ncbi:hypothetical protein U9M48_024116 [Paspalum notatum var. saurae]|uniref:Uncharacterized protein n=1 Tax=Paspalum notatum var. saurae TaxID=547442 RepID=A0AAQ3TN13_PASNO
MISYHPMLVLSLQWCPLAQTTKQRKEHNIRTKQTSHSKIEIRMMKERLELAYEYHLIRVASGIR